MRHNSLIILVLLGMATLLVAQETLLPAGDSGLQKRSWILLQQEITVRGSKTIEIPGSSYEDKSLNYVAFFVDGELVVIDEIPPFSITHDFGNYTHKANVLAIGVKYLLPPEPEPLPQIAESTQQPETQELTISGKTSISLLSPAADSFAGGEMLLRAAVNIASSQLQRVDFLVDGRLVGSAAAPPYQIEHNFGQGFDAHTITAVAMLSDGSSLEDSVRTMPVEKSDYYIRTSLVTVDATVVDWKDRLVGDLKREEFSLREDGVEQKITHFAIEERPIRVAILLDISNSMRARNRMNSAITAAQKLLVMLNKDKDKAALIAFNDQVHKLSGFTNDFMKLSSILAKLEPAGGTAINDTLDSISVLFDDEIGRKAVVLITDGHDEHSNVNIGTAVEKVRRAGVKIYSIGIFEYSRQEVQMQEAIAEKSTRRSTKRPNVDPDDVRKSNRTYKRGSDTRTLVFEGLSDASGGTSFFPKKMEEMPIIMERIAQELRTMYTLGYSSSNKSSSNKWRRIRIGTKRSGLTVKAKEGYYTK
jgi:Ca-activated chloride channel family protein